MANKAINDLLKYGYMNFIDNLNTTYVPANWNTLYANAYNNWSIYAGGADTNAFIKPQLDGSKFITRSNYNGFLGKLYRNLENYILGRPISLNFKALAYYSGVGLRGSSHEIISLYGNTEVTAVASRNGLPLFGGIMVGLILNEGNNAFGVLSVNNTIVQQYAVSYDTEYTFFVDVYPTSGGYKIDWSYNTTGTKPSSAMYTYTASSVTSYSNSLILGVGCQPANYGYNGGYLDAVEALLM